MGLICKVLTACSISQCAQNVGVDIPDAALHVHGIMGESLAHVTACTHLRSLRLTLLRCRGDSSRHLRNKVIMQAGELRDHAGLALQQQLCT